MKVKRTRKIRMSMEDLCNIGRRPNVMQIVPTRHVMRFGLVHEDQDQSMAKNPLASPTGPGGAAGFRNRAGSQIAVPQVTNIYMGEFWGDRNLVEAFSKAVVENGYLDPLKELNYGTGPGKYLGAVDGPALKSGAKFHDADAQSTVSSLLDSGTIKADINSLFVLILPDGVTSIIDSDGSQSCQSFCGYHDAFNYQATEIAYAVLPSTLCQGCGGLIGDFTAVYSHELAEAVTDKVPGEGWVADDGEENGDLEAWVLFGWGPPDDPNRYTIQGYYTNERGNTSGAWRDTSN
ncbi:MAG TPA: hypothetical protein VLT16_13085 [Candidatus Limnocylindrales bacterium]|nr:hypothetical protein [Candidatus Limnocylindrales bacterium]